jgi:hypothetical protein
MSNIKSLQTQVHRMKKVLLPNPKIIDCTGARDQLLAKLESYMTEEELNTPVELTEEQKQFAEKFSAMLDEMVKEDERKYNVRFVSYRDP